MISHRGSGPSDWYLSFLEIDDAFMPSITLSHVTGTHQFQQVTVHSMFSLGELHVADWLLFLQNLPGFPLVPSTNLAPNFRAVFIRGPSSQDNNGTSSSLLGAFSLRHNLLHATLPRPPNSQPAFQGSRVLS